MRNMSTNKHSDLVRKCLPAEHIGGTQFETMDAMCAAIRNMTTRELGHVARHGYPTAAEEARARQAATYQTALSQIERELAAGRQ